MPKSMIKPNRLGKTNPKDRKTLAFKKNRFKSIYLCIVFFMRLVCLVIWPMQIHSYKI